MKNKLLSISILLMLFGITSSAIAATYTDTHTTNTYMKGRLFGSDDTYSWTFDLTNDGYNPATETVTSASIALNFKDDSRSWWDGWEWASIVAGSEYTFLGEIDTGTETISVSSLVSLNATGLLNVTLTATLGDFYFLGGALTANTVYTPPVSSVPAPSALLLMGSGIIGIAAATRRKTKKA